MPLSFSFSAEILYGEYPLAFKPWSLSFIQTRANASLPNPFEVGSTTVKQAAVAIAASTAFPPALIISSPACAANGCDVATIPLFP